VSRCKCEFFCVFYGDVSLEPGELKQVPPPPPADLDIWNSNQDPFDAYTLKHHDLHVSTNPLQVSPPASLKSSSRVLSSDADYRFRFVAKKISFQE
jgi:hypothetical protein